MQNGQKIEDAARRLQELIAEDIVCQLRGTNEATTRLRLVDEVLALLGWRKEDYNPELPTTAGDYTDYRLSIDGVHRLIVEAKKVGRVNPPSNPLRKSEYENGYLHKNCGKEMTDLLDQCLKYSMSSGIRYAVATTGDAWIVLVNFLDGFDWHKLRAVVFHSLEEVYQRFDEFYKLISRNAVAQNSLRDKFGHLISVPPCAIRPRDQILDVPDVRLVADQQIITAFFEHFMGDIAQSDQVSLLKECYVSDRKIHEYSRELQHLLEYNPVLDEIEKSAPEVDSKVIKKEVEFQLSSGRPKVVLLVRKCWCWKKHFCTSISCGNNYNLRIRVNGNRIKTKRACALLLIYSINLPSIYRQHEKKNKN